MDYLRTIKLGFGQGSPGKQACWMTALQSHIGGQWTDQCDCVDPLINSLCIWINDSFGSDDEARTEAVMDFGLFAPLGTRGDEQSQLRRACHFLDVTTRQWLPEYLRSVGKTKEADNVANAPKIVDDATCREALKIAYANAFAIAFANANANAYANANAFAIAFANAIAYAIAYANANAIDYAIDYAKKDFVKSHALPLLRELIELGPCAPKEPEIPACDVDKFLELCGAK